MLDDVRDVTRGALDVLELLAVLSALALFVFAAASLLLATVRVALRGRVLVLPFAGNDERRSELMDLFVRRLTEIEQAWISLAENVERTKEDVNRRDSRERDASVVGNQGCAPTLLVKGEKLPDLQPSGSDVAAAGAAPRESGHELLPAVIQLGREGAIADADLGVISLAGVAFSPRAVLALLRAAPAIFARRTLRGTIVSLPDRVVISVEYKERRLRGRSPPKTQAVDVRNDQWLPAIEELTFALAKQRVYLLRERPRRGEPRPGARNADARALQRSAWRPIRSLRRSVSVRRDADPRTTWSESVRLAEVEAASWDACRSFLAGYAAHLRHFRDGRAADREEALTYYQEALTYQKGFPRAAYNRATLLYNRYLPEANRQAIEDFSLATRSGDRGLKPLAFAGLALTHCQAIQRFGRAESDHREQARDAAETATELAPDLEESVFARGWILQIDGEWVNAIQQYVAIVQLPDTSAPALRIRSFALNNAAWIWLNKLDDQHDARKEAEKLLWQAVALYPNKQGYANLAEIARRCDRREDALKLFEKALSLDDSYANALNERAIVEAELCEAAARGSQKATAEAWLGAARRDAEKAQRLAEADKRFASNLQREFQKAEQLCLDELARR